MTEKRWVYGNRFEKWYLVGSEDRDWSCSVSQEEMKKIGEKEATAKYIGDPVLGVSEALSL